MNDQASGFSKHIKPLLKPSAFILLYLSIYLRHGNNNFIVAPHPNH